MRWRRLWRKCICAVLAAVRLQRLGQLRALRAMPPSPSKRTRDEDEEGQVEVRCALEEACGRAFTVSLAASDTVLRMAGVRHELERAWREAAVDEVQEEEAPRV